MKKNRLSEQLLEELRKVPIVQVACKKIGVSRNSVYRWRRADKKFAKDMDKAIEEGVEYVNDMSEHQLLAMIQEKNLSAIRFWLKHRSQKYKNRVEVTTKHEIEELSDSQQAVVKKALQLASLTGEQAIDSNKENQYG